MKKLATILLAMLCTLPMWSQSNQDIEVTIDSVSGLKHYKASDNWFISVHGGANYSMSENARFGTFKDMLKGGFGLSVGKYFSPAIGSRVQLSYIRQQSRADREAIAAYPQVYGDGNFGYNIFAGYLDGLFNLNNIFGQYRETTRFNVIGIIGLGFNSTSNFDDKVEGWRADKVAAPYEVNTDGKTLLAARAGLMASYRLSNALDLELEITAQATDDAYNGTRHDEKYDSYLNAFLGLTYHFKDQYGDRRFRYRTLSDRGTIDDLNRKINELRGLIREPETIVKVEEEVFRSEILNMTISFIIDKSNITDIQKKNVAEVAKYIEEHPDLNIVITGYADVQTAYPAYNLALSERRAKSVHKCLVEEFGVDPSRLRIDFKGDTVQPYKLKNEWNRVVIFMTEPRNK
ncbi:MAG: OmpA family protein [Fibrobacter sp.]|nr:OmpA family protein [Fibrobacter sp.]